MKLREKVNAGKNYCPPIKRHEMKANNPFFNGKLGFKGIKSGMYDSSPQHNPSLDKMLSHQISNNQSGSSVSFASPL